MMIVKLLSVVLVLPLWQSITTCRAFIKAYLSTFFMCNYHSEYATCVELERKDQPIFLLNCYARKFGSSPTNHVFAPAKVRRTLIQNANSENAFKLSLRRYYIQLAKLAHDDDDDFNRLFVDLWQPSPGKFSMRFACCNPHRQQLQLPLISMNTSNGLRRTPRI